jgi:hypothetical protein
MRVIFTAPACQLSIFPPHLCLSNLVIAPGPSQVLAPSSIAKPAGA